MKSSKIFKAIVAFFLLCAASSSAFASFIGGMNAYMAGDYDTAMIEWAESAKMGEPKSMAYIGYIYFDETGGHHDDAKALEWFTRAADLGDPDGTATLARIYAHGWGVSRDMDKAYDFMIKVADVDNFAAQMTASEFYEMGFGTSIDLEKALEHAKRLPVSENGIPVMSAREERIKNLERKIAEQNKTR